MVDDCTTEDGSPLPVYPCPSCSYRADAATSLEHPAVRPRPGDVALCSRCAVINEFQADFSLRTLSPEEFNALPIAVQNVMYEAVLSTRRSSQNRT